MPYNYLDNVWGNNQVIRGFGDALNANFAGLVEARARQRAQEQTAALNAAYYALERQKFDVQKPGMEAEAAERRARANQLVMQTQMGQQQMRDIEALKGAAMQQYMQANPAMQQVPPQQLPTAPPMTPTANMMEAAMPQQVPATMGPGAPTMANFGQLNAATINAILASQAAQTPATAERLLEGTTLRPGDVPVNMITQQRGPQVEGYVSPYQLMQYGLGRERQQTAEERAQEQARHNVAMETKPPKESLAEKLYREAQERKSGKKVVRTQADFDALPPGTMYIGDDGKTYRKP